MELGVRLEKHGCKFVFGFDAKTTHRSDHTDLNVWMRRAYNYGNGMAAGLGQKFETRTAHHDYLKAHGLVEASQDTPKRARPSAVELARKRRLFEQAYEKVRRGPIC